MRRVTADQLAIACEPSLGLRLSDVPLLILVGLTGAGKSTAVERLAADLAFAALLPDRRALTDALILPMMTGDGTLVSDRVTRFRLTAAFKDRHPGGMGDVLQWLTLPGDLPAGVILFDGLRGEAEVTAAARLPNARFLVLECSPQERLWRLCGRNDPFDGTHGRGSAATGVGREMIHARLIDQKFDTLVPGDVLDRLARSLADLAVDPDAVSRGAAIIVEESRHYDPEAATAALRRSAPSRTLVVDTATTRPVDVAAAVASNWPDIVKV